MRATRHRIFRGLTGAFAAVLALSACATTDDAQQEDPTQEDPTQEAEQATADEAPTDESPDAADGLDDIEELVLVTSSLADLHLDPVAPIEFGIFKVNMALTYDYIVGADPDGELNPDTGLAESWERIEEENKWVFTLRDGPTFHNGDPVRAEDAVFHLERVMNPDSGTGSGPIFSALIESVEIVDDLTFEVVTSGPDITLPFLLSNHGLLEGMLVPSEYFQSFGDDLESQKRGFLQDPVGSGPYKVVEAQAGSHVLLERNEDYWLGNPRFPRIRVLEVADEQTRVAALQSGEAHIIEMSRRDLETAEEAGFTIHRKPGASTMGLMLHEQWVDENPLSDIRVREAINRAIDKETLLDELFAGQGRLVDTWRIGSLSLGYEYNDPPEHDPERTSELLEQAGYEDLEITLIGFERQGLPEARDMMEAITGMLQDAGIDATLEWTDQGVSFDTWFSWPDHPDQAPMLDRWGPSVSLNNTGNQTFWQQNAKFVYLPDGLARITDSEELTRFIEVSDSAGTPEEYEENTRAAQQYLRENFIELAMFELDSLYASVPEIRLEDWPMDIYQWSWNVETLAVPR